MTQKQTSFMEYFYLNIINRPRAVSKSFSQRTTAVVANATKFDPVSLLVRKQLIIYLVYFLALTSFLTISGCAQELPDFNTLASSSASLTDKVVMTSAEREVTTLTDTPPDFVYKTERSLGSKEKTNVEQTWSGTAHVNGKRLVLLTTEIDERTLESANQLYSLAEVSSKPIDVIIDSPGGYIHHGLYFIQAMRALQAKGIAIRCHVPRFAASMAFTIFTQCSERNALPYAQLLFHPPRISGKFLLTPRNAASVAQGLAEIENVLLRMIIPAMGVSKERGGDWFV